MLKILTYEVIVEYIKKYCNEDESEPICAYGVIRGSSLDVMMFGSLSTFIHKHMVIGFTDRNMVLVSLDAIGKPNAYCKMGCNKIISTKVVTGVFGFETIITIGVAGGSAFKFSLNKHFNGLKMQNGNIRLICDLLKSLNRGYGM